MSERGIICEKSKRRKEKEKVFRRLMRKKEGRDGKTKDMDWHKEEREKKREGSNANSRFVVG